MDSEQNSRYCKTVNLLWLTSKDSTYQRESSSQKRVHDLTFKSYLVSEWNSF